LIERDSLPRFLKKASFSGSLRKPRASAKSTLKMNFDENTISDLLDMVQVRFFQFLFLFFSIIIIIIIINK